MYSSPAPLFILSRSYVERIRNGGHGRVQNGRIEGFHEERHRDEPRQELLRASFDESGSVAGIKSQP